MIIEVLILHYIQEKRQKPNHANELLDYIQNEYVNGKLSIFQYKSLCQDLYLRGASKRLLDETTPLSLFKQLPIKNESCF